MPVYLGAPNIDEYESLGSASPHRAIIKAHDFDNFTQLAQHISFLDTHDDEYMKYHTWRGLLPDDAVWPVKWAQQPQWQELRKMEVKPAAGKNSESHYNSLRICEIVKQRRVDKKVSSFPVQQTTNNNRPRSMQMLTSVCHFLHLDPNHHGHVSVGS